MNWLVIGAAYLWDMASTTRIRVGNVAEGQAIPGPLSQRSYSSKFNLQVRESLHRRPAIQPAEEHLSLNQSSFDASEARRRRRRRESLLTQHF